MVIEVRSADEGAPGTTLAFPARAGKHPGFYSARIQLADPGRGSATIRVGPESAAGEGATLDIDFDVLPPARPWREHAGAIAFPFGLLAIFVWHQRRCEDRRTRRHPSLGQGPSPTGD